MERNSHEYIKWILSTNPKAVERAVVVLYNRQTSDEKISGTTFHKNGRGFAACDARRGTYMAKWILKGNHLTGKWLNDALSMSLKYINQLVEEATLKLQREQNDYRGNKFVKESQQSADEQAIIESDNVQEYNDSANVEGVVRYE